MIRFQREQLMKEKGYEIPPSEPTPIDPSSVPIPVPGTPLSRVILYMTRSIPASEFSSECLLKEGGNAGSENETSMV